MATCSQKTDMPKPRSQGYHQMAATQWRLQPEQTSESTLYGRSPQQKRQIERLKARGKLEGDLARLSEDRAARRKRPGAATRPADFFGTSAAQGPSTSATASNVITCSILADGTTGRSSQRVAFPIQRSRSLGAESEPEPKPQPQLETETGTERVSGGAATRSEQASTVPASRRGAPQAGGSRVFLTLLSIYSPPSIRF